MESIFNLGILLSVVDRVTGPAARMTRNLDALRNKALSLGPAFDKFKTYGMRVAAGGAAMIALLGGTVMATAATQKALGELSSVGITDLAALESAGASFSGKWAGTTKAQFIAAAYDIKSGISSLTDTGVAEFTKLAAVTGKATKSTTAEMTSLFATGYGIYKQMYSDLSDMQFGEVFSAGIAASVQQFKTTGSGMAQAISALGATATTAKAPLQEQLAILGMLQATMTGSEAGTKYKALMQAAAGAGQKLNLQFMDANNQLLSMPQILMKLKSKYGDTLDAIEKMEIQKAFGTQEAVAVIDLLYGKVGDLEGNVKSLSTAMKQGTGFTEQMAAAMNKDIGSGIALLGQRFHNLIEVIGKQLIPVLTPLFAYTGNLINRFTQFAEKHKSLTRVIVIGVGVIAALAFTLGSLAAALGVVGVMVPGIITGLALAKGALIAATVSTWGFSTALLANPITWIVLAVAALGTALYFLCKKFEIVRMVAAGFLLGKAVIAKTLAWIKGLIPRFLEAGRGLWSALAAGVKSAIMKPVEVVQKGLSFVRNLLPFSDAKEGPLAQLTLSGAKIMQTLGAGVQASVPGLKTAVAGALASAVIAAPGIDVGITGTGREPAGQATIKTERTVSTKKTFIIQTLNVTLPNVTDGESFRSELQRLMEGHDA